MLVILYETESTKLTFCMRQRDTDTYILYETESYWHLHSVWDRELLTLTLETETHVNCILCGDCLVVVSSDVVNPAAQQLTLQHEGVHPLGVGVGRGGADQFPVPPPLLDLHVGQSRVQWWGVGLLYHVGLVISQDCLNMQRRIEISQFILFIFAFKCVKS